MRLLSILALVLLLALDAEGRLLPKLFGSKKLSSTDIRQCLAKLPTTCTTRRNGKFHFDLGLSFGKCPAGNKNGLRFVNNLRNVIIKSNDVLRLPQITGSTQEVLVRRIGAVSRVEYSYSIIRPEHVKWGRQKRRRSGRRQEKSYLKRMGALLGDRVGSLVPTSLGGETKWWNMMPQSKQLNNGHRNKWIADSTYNTEAAIAKFLSLDTRNYVRLFVVPLYENDSTGRPSEVYFLALMYNKNGSLKESLMGHPANAHGRHTNRLC